MTAAASAPAVAVALVFVSAWLLGSPGTHALRRGAEGSGAPPTEPVRRRSTVGKAALAFAVVWLLRTSGPQILVLAGGASAVTWVGSRLYANWRLREARARNRAAVVEFCDALSAELESGLPALTALQRAGAACPASSSAVNAARLGDDVAQALRSTASSTAGAEGLRSIAAAWDVAARSGAALGVVLARVAAGLRSDEEARAEVTAALGPPRATAKMLAVLPLFGIALGMSMGANPLAFLLQTTAGVICLAAGTALAVAGLWWVERLAGAAEV